MRLHRRRSPAVRRAAAWFAALAVLGALNLVAAVPAHAAHELRTFDATPETQSVLVGSPVTFTGTVSLAADVLSGDITIYWEMDGGPNDNFAGGGASGWTPALPDMSCLIAVGNTACTTAAYSPTAASVDYVIGWIHHAGSDPAAEPDGPVLAGEGQNELTDPGAVPEPDDTDTVSVLVGRSLDVVPQNENPPGSDTGTGSINMPTTLTATLTPGADAVSGAIDVYFEIEGGPNDITGPGNPAGSSREKEDFKCTVAVGTASCQGGYTPTLANLDQFRVWIHTTGANPATEADSAEGVNEALIPGEVAEPDRTDVSEILVSTGGGGGTEILNCNDEQPAASGGDDDAKLPTTGDAASTHETYTCLVTLGGAAVSGRVIDGELLSDPNDADDGKVGPPDFTCTTAANGRCTFDVPVGPAPLAAGTALICGWIDNPPDDVVDNANAANGGGCGEAYNATEGDNSTDVMRIVWENRTLTTIDILNEDDARILPAQNNHTVNVAALDQFNNGVNGVDIDLYILGGPNRDTGSTARECVTGALGTCGVSYTSNNANGIDRFCAWHDITANDLYVPGGPVGDGGACTTNEPEAPGTDGGDPLTDRGQVTWSGGATVPTTLEATPETPPGGAVAEGTEYGPTVTVKDENTNPLNGVAVNFEVIGAGDPDPTPGDSPGTPDRTCTTGSPPGTPAGTCTLSGAPGPLGSSTTITSAVAGNTTVRVWVSGQTADTAEGADAGEPPDEPAGGTNAPGGTIEPDVTDMIAIRWGKITTDLTATVSPTVCTYGCRPTISGRLMGEGSGVGSADVVIKRRTVGSATFVLLGSQQTAADGTFTFQDTSQPSASADYEASYAGDATHHPDTAPLMRVGIRPGVIYNANPSTLPAGQPSTFSGQIIPGHPGKRVLLQKYNGQQGVWGNHRWVSLDSASRFRVQYTNTATGGLIFRIAYPTQDLDHVWNVSRAIRVTWT